MIKDVVLSMRPKQWIKNLFIFTALIFSRNIFTPEKLLLVCLGFFIFSIISGTIYLLNDLIDAPLDRKHPQKKDRPIASGRLKSKTVIISFVSLLFSSLLLSFRLNHGFGIICLLYSLLQIAYSLWLKHIIILDVFSIAAGFLFRIISGAVIISVPVSHWLLICSLFLSLYLGFGKRRHELLTLEKEAVNHRPALSDYSVEFLDQLITTTITATAITYALYTLSEETIKKFHTTNLKLTIPFVIYGLFRYLYLIRHKKQGGNPELTLFFDKPFIFNIFLYITSVIIILYFL